MVSKRHELWPTYGFRLKVRFYLPSVKSVFHFIVRLCRRKSANRTQTHFAKRWTVGRANKQSYKIWGRLSQKIGGQKTYTFVPFFDDLET